MKHNDNSNSNSSASSNNNFNSHNNKKNTKNAVAAATTPPIMPLPRLYGPTLGRADPLIPLIAGVRNRYNEDES